MTSTRSTAGAAAPVSAGEKFHAMQPRKKGTPAPASANVGGVGYRVVSLQRSRRAAAWCAAAVVPWRTRVRPPVSIMKRGVAPATPRHPSFSNRKGEHSIRLPVTMPVHLSRQRRWVSATSQLSVTIDHVRNGPCQGLLNTAQLKRRTWPRPPCTLRRQQAMDGACASGSSKPPAVCGEDSSSTPASALTSAAPQKPNAVFH